MKVENFLRFPMLFSLTMLIAQASLASIYYLEGELILLTFHSVAAGFFAGLVSHPANFE